MRLAGATALALILGVLPDGGHAQSCLSPGQLASIPTPEALKDQPPYLAVAYPGGQTRVRIIEATGEAITFQVPLVAVPPGARFEVFSVPPPLVEPPAVLPWWTTPAAADATSTEPVEAAVEPTADAPSPEPTIRPAERPENLSRPAPAQPAARPKPTARPAPAAPATRPAPPPRDVPKPPRFVDGEGPGKGDNDSRRFGGGRSSFVDSGRDDSDSSDSGAQNPGGQNPGNDKAVGNSRFDGVFGREPSGGFGRGRNKIALLPARAAFAWMQELNPHGLVLAQADAASAASLGGGEMCAVSGPAAGGTGSAPTETAEATGPGTGDAGTAGGAGDAGSTPTETADATGSGTEDAGSTGGSGDTPTETADATGPGAEDTGTTEGSGDTGSIPTETADASATGGETAAGPTTGDAPSDTAESAASDAEDTGTTEGPGDTGSIPTETADATGPGEEGAGTTERSDDTGDAPTDTAESAAPGAEDTGTTDAPGDTGSIPTETADASATGGETAAEPTATGDAPTETAESAAPDAEGAPTAEGSDDTVGTSTDTAESAAPGAEDTGTTDAPGDTGSTTTETADASATGGETVPGPAAGDAPSDSADASGPGAGGAGGPATGGTPTETAETTDSAADGAGVTETVTRDAPPVLLAPPLGPPVITPEELLANLGYGAAGLPASQRAGTLAVPAPSGAPEFALLAPADTLQTAADVIASVGGASLRGATFPNLGLQMLVVDLGGAVPEAEIRALLQFDGLDASFDANHLFETAQAPRIYAHALVGTAPVGRCRLPQAVRIGLIDGPVDRANPYLQAVAVTEFSALDPHLTAGATDHATGIASLMAAPPAGDGFGGIAPGAELLSATAFADFNGRDAASMENIARSVDWLLGQKVAVINMSLAGPYNGALARILNTAATQGAILVAASGNDATADVAYPGADPSVIAVTAVDAAKRPYRDASSGTAVEFAAPGVDVLVAEREGVAYRSGTSYASAVLSALIAYEIGLKDASAAEIRDRLRALSEDLGEQGRDHQYGWGLPRLPECGF